MVTTNTNISSKPSLRVVGPKPTRAPSGKRVAGTLGRLREFARLLSSVYGREFVVGDLEQSAIKGFCTGLIDGCKHPWRKSMRGLGVRTRLSIAHSLFLFRKLVPSPSPGSDKYVSLMTRESPDIDADFSSFCEAEIGRIFHDGWARKTYASHALSVAPPVKSCVENSRRKGGPRGMVADGRWRDHQDYVLSVLAGEGSFSLLPSRVTAVETCGKWRILSVPPANMNLLKPLHRSMYDHLSKHCDWLLRGDATPGRFSDFVPKAGEVFVSGDYEGATDNLNTAVQKFILSAVLRRCGPSVPLEVREMAIRSLSVDFELDRATFGAPIPGEPSVYRQTRGQMMGNLMSFPLLCLVNYLTFRFVVRRDVPLRINGDDIVFRATPEEVELWKSAVGRSGLVLSLGKTMVHRKFFSLNSAIFESSRRGSRYVPFFRPLSLFGAEGMDAADSLSSLQGRFRAFSVGFTRPNTVQLVNRFFLRSNLTSIYRSRRSVTRGLEMNVSYSTLVASNLWKREAFYLSLEKEDPLPVPPAEIEAGVFPPGWERLRASKLTKEQLQDNSSYFGEVVALSWVTRPLRKDVAAGTYIRRVAETGFDLVTSLGESKKIRRMLARSVSAEEYSRYVKPRLTDLHRIRMRPKKRMCVYYRRVAENFGSAQELSSKIRRTISFVKGESLEPSALPSALAGIPFAGNPAPLESPLCESTVESTSGSVVNTTEGTEVETQVSLVWPSCGSLGSPFLTTRRYNSVPPPLSLL